MEEGSLPPAAVNRQTETLAAEMLLQKELCDHLRDELEDERRNLKEVQEKYSVVLNESHVKTLKYQAALQAVQRHLPSDASGKGVGVIGAKSTPGKNSPTSSSSSSQSATAKALVRATSSLPAASTGSPTNASKMVHQGSLDPAVLTVQTGIPEGDDSGSSTSSGVRSPSFYGFK